MKLALITVGDGPEVSSITTQLVDKGHTIPPHGVDDLDHATVDAVILIVGHEVESADVVPAWDGVTAACSHGSFVIAGSFVPIDELVPAVVNLPHAGDWIELAGDENDADTLLTALENLRPELTGDHDDSEDRARPKRRREGSRSFLSRLQRVRPFDTSEARNTEGADEGEIAKRAPKIFLSYSRRDKLAEDVANELRRNGADVWMDSTSIPGAADWRKSIGDGIGRCDAFVILLSPSVVRESKWVWTELGLAHAKGKTIVPVTLRRLPVLPDGFDVLLSGLQQISLSPDFEAGMVRVMAAIGSSVSDPERSIRARLGRSSARVRRFSHEHELSKTAAKYGSAAMAGAIAVGTLALKIAAAQDQQRADNERARLDGERERRTIALEQYTSRTLKLLERNLKEVQRANRMRPDEYQREFRPKFMRTLGQLEMMQPEDGSVAERHHRMVDDLQGLLEQFDSTMDRLTEGDWPGYERAVERLNDAWSDTVSSSIDWLRGMYV